MFCPRVGHDVDRTVLAQVVDLADQLLGAGAQWWYVLQVVGTVEFVEHFCAPHGVVESIRSSEDHFCN